ncbi:MAG: hypothetical protein A2309_13780 [Bacteroidetes bacterium RIFOXYB2_FULL_35_7]|nr:MAG: hypothetical protein A2X01_10065 [Bacteroidetes bacterium GWF2_35_48]OFY97133.1 MAG: hypothetical protein A2309_13780 [Bacteroidetes bacterium RIFOXYB2_FULL_35_7]OFY97989.1 MAG: hypothetical protein A2491_19090 [Bacteroidetes bacterium RIFOXYC12_FULL_35_7]
MKTVIYKSKLLGFHDFESLVFDVFFIKHIVFLRTQFSNPVRYCEKAGEEAILTGLLEIGENNGLRSRIKNRSKSKDFVVIFFNP